MAGRECKCLVVDMHLSDDVLVCGDAIHLHLVLLHHLSVELLREARILGRAERHILHVLIDALSLHVNFRLLVHLHLLAGLLGLFGLEQGFQGFLVNLGFRSEQPGHRENLGRKPSCSTACNDVGDHRLSSHSL